MVRTITNKYDGTCHKCGCALRVGERVRWSGRGRIFCLSVHGHGGQTKATIRERQVAHAKQDAWDRAFGHKS